MRQCLEELAAQEAATPVRADSQPGEEGVLLKEMEAAEGAKAGIVCEEAEYAVVPWWLPPERIPAQYSGAPQLTCSVASICVLAGAG